jgi:hypothetical protein
MVEAKVVSKKNLFGLDFEYLLVAILFFIVLFSAKGYALTVSAPESVTIKNSGSFYVDITNDSLSGKDFSINFFAPVKTEIISPVSIAPNESVKAKIIIYNKYSERTEINSLLEVVSDGKIVQKEVTLVFEPNASNSDNYGSKILSGLFSFGSSLGEMTGFTFIDWVIFWALIIIVAFLLIAFISRVRNRV